MGPRYAARRCEEYGGAVSAVDRQRSLVLRDPRYLGGHPAAPAALDRIDVHFEETGVRFDRRGEQLGTISWDRVRDLTADAESVRSRMTVPRVWFLGIFAALFPRRDRSVLFRLADDRGALLFEVDGIGLDELREGLVEIRRRHLL